MSVTDKTQGVKRINWRRMAATLVREVATKESSIVGTDGDSFQGDASTVIEEGEPSTIEGKPRAVRSWFYGVRERLRNEPDLLVWMATGGGETQIGLARRKTSG